MGWLETQRRQRKAFSGEGTEVLLCPEEHLDMSSKDVLLHPASLPIACGVHSCVTDLISLKSSATYLIYNVKVVLERLSRYLAEIFVQDVNECPHKCEDIQRVRCTNAMREKLRGHEV